MAGVELVAGGDGGAIPGYRTAMTISVVLCLAGAAIAFTTIRRAMPTVVTTQPSVLQPCGDPCLKSTDAEAA